MKTITVGGSPQAIAVGGGRVWVSVQNALVAPGQQAGGRRSRHRGYPPDSLDPALAYNTWSWPIEYATCAKLLNYPDRPAPAGSRLEPEVATALPIPTDGGKSYTFTIRPRLPLLPAVECAGHRRRPSSSRSSEASARRRSGPATAQGYLGDVVGAPAYMAGKAKHISGLSVRGNTLTIRLTHAAPRPPVAAHDRRSSAPSLPTPPIVRPRREHGARGRTVLRRLLHPRAGRGAETKPQLPRGAAAHARRDRLQRERRQGAERARRSRPARPTSRPTSPPTRSRASPPATAPAAPPPAPATNAISSTRRSGLATSP